MTGARASPPEGVALSHGLRDLEDSLNTLELTCKAFRVVSLLICECREDLQSHDREGVSVLLDCLTTSVEGCIQCSWKVLRKEESHGA